MSTRLSLVALVALGLGSLTACNPFEREQAHLYAVADVVTPVMPVPPSTGPFGSNSVPGPVDLATYQFSDASGLGDTAYIRATKDKNARNRLRSILVRHSQEVCRITQAQIAGTNDWINFTLGETTTILAGLGALVTPASTARALAGAAALTNATRAQVNEIFYQNSIKTAIIQKMEEIRINDLKNISQHDNAEVSEYSVDDMINDIVHYHNDCSFYAALTQMAKPTEPVISVDVAKLIDTIKVAVDKIPVPPK